jgi:Putative NADH-flavin reductase
MKVALIGASGNVGSRLLNELLSRGHEVTAVVRDPEKMPVREGVIVKRGDVNDGAAFSPLITGTDAVISATRFQTTDPHKFIEAVRHAAVPRLLVVGGAGSLETAPGIRLVDTPDFPAAYKPEALAGSAFLDALRAELNLDWTFLSPSAMFAPGERTAKFRIGGDELLVDNKGNSHVSMEDFAIAMADELENPKHSRQRFTVGY